MNTKSDQHAGFAARAAIYAALLVLAVIVLFLLWHLSQMLLAVFAGILLAIFLDGLSEWLSKHTHLPRAVSLPLVILSLTALFALAGFMLGPRISEQFARLTEKIPAALNSLKDGLAGSALGRNLLRGPLTTRDLLPVGPDIIGRVTGIFSTALGAIGGLVLVFFVGIYLAVNPRQYVNNVMRLFPRRRRQRLGEVLAAVGTALRWWLAGRFAAMIVIGLLMAGGLWIAGIPLALTLGLIAALLSFIPFIGPLLSTIPIILVALAEKPILVVWALVVYLIVQMLESYVITPWIQKRAVFIPPALLITVQILMSVLFGIPGMFLATPITLVVIILIQMLYVQDVLGDSARVMGDHARKHST